MLAAFNRSPTFYHPETLADSEALVEVACDAPHASARCAWNGRYRGSAQRQHIDQEAGYAVLRGLGRLETFPQQPLRHQVSAGWEAVFKIVQSNIRLGSFQNFAPNTKEPQ
jgi:hypothetical protein